MTAIGSSAGLDIGRVIQTTFAVIGRNFVPFLVLSLIFAGLPAFAVAWAQVQIQAGDGSSTMVGGFVAIAAGLLSLATTPLLQGVVVHLTAADLNGGRPSISDGLQTGVRNIFPLLGIGLLYALGLGAGALIFLVPGLIIATMWCLAAPVRVVERRGVFASLGRSRDLTKGSRWAIFGLLVLYVILSAVIQAVLGGLLGGLAGMAQRGPATLVVTPLISTLNGMVGAAGIAVLYAEIRRTRDGVGVSELAAVFD